jgi:hypothetical protein
LATTTTVTIGVDRNGKVTFNPSGAINLEEYDSVSLSPPSGATINSISIYHFDSSQPNDKGTLLGTWTRGESVPEGLSDVYHFTANTDATVTIEDVDDPTSDDPYWYSISMSYNGSTYTSDPELINKARVDPPPMEAEA